MFVNLSESEKYKQFNFRYPKKHYFYVNYEIKTMKNLLFAIFTIVISFNLVSCDQLEDVVGSDETIAGLKGSIKNKY